MSYPQTDMTEHLIAEHGVTPAKLRDLWENRNPDLSIGWDEVLDVNHDMIHQLAQGKAVRGVGSGVTK